jgi:hypothetical protein
LKKAPNERSDDELTKLVSATQNISFFANLSKEHGQHIYRLCCQSMEYEFQDAGKIIFQKGTIIYSIAPCHKKKCKATVVKHFPIF